MTDRYYINFCMRQYPDYGGTYTAQNLFKKALHCYFIDLKIPNFTKNSEADYTVSSGINPFTAYVKSLRSNFFSFIPSNIRQNAVGVIAHSLFLSHFSYAYNCSRQLRLPLYIIPHGASDPYVFSYGKLKKRLWLNTIGNLASNHAKKIIFSTELEKKKSIFSQSISKGEVCPLALDFPEHIDKSYCRQLMHQKFNLGDEDKILLYFGKLDSFKRPLETIESFIRVKPKNWKLLVVGYYDDIAFKNKIDAFSCYEDIIIHPPVFGKEKWIFLAGADLFVLLSHRENFGLAVAEAASVGTPVMISKGVDIYPYFEKVTNNLVFDICSSKDIDKALSYINDYDQFYLQSLGLIYKTIVQEKCCFDTFSRCLHQILEIL